MAKKIPTDLNILQVIYDKYYEEFCNFDNDESIRSAKIYVPIDCKIIAKEFDVNGDIIFGRLYYHLANKYKYTDHGKNDTIRLFEFTIGQDRHCINFPFMASVLSELKLQDKRFKLTLLASITALIISFASLAVTSYDKAIQQDQVSVLKENITKK